MTGKVANTYKETFDLYLVTFHIKVLYQTVTVV